eukprot:2028210-Amphidinium_carterae.1
MNSIEKLGVGCTWKDFGAPQRFPADNFTVSPSSESRASVRHLGPLKGLLPFTLSSALQRPQLVRRKHAGIETKKAAT